MKLNMQIFLSLITLIVAASCKLTESSDVSNYDFSYKDNWRYFKLEDTITVRVVDHLSVEAMCGNMAFGSITIAIRNEGDTIRIIDLCNMEKYKANDLIKFKPAENPGFSVHLPYSTIFNDKTNEIDPSFYDTNILETTYGYALRNDQ